MSDTSKKKKNIMDTVENVVLAVLFVAVVILLISVIMGTSPFFFVQGISMHPTLENGDLIAIDRAPFDNLKIGDIIIYDKPEIYPDPVVHRIIKIGIPPSIAGIVFSIVYLFINRITAHFGTQSIAALGIGNRMESLSYMTCFGFSIAAATLVGQNLGAGKPERASQSAWRTVYITSFITGGVSILFLSLPKAISSFFITDSQVIPIAVDYLRILSISQVFMAWEIVLEGAFSGAGDTLPPMMVSLPGSILRIPLAYLLAMTLGLGINGVWWSITLTSIVKGILLAFWFKQGKWKKRQI